MGRVNEYGNSLGDFISRVQMAFERAYHQPGADGAVRADIWVLDVFEDYVVVRDGDQMYNVAFTIEDKAIKFAPRAEWKPVQLAYIAEYLYEFKGQFPDVPTYPHIDVGLLTQNDPDPFYVVLPVARIGEVSGNGLVYDEELVSEIEAQLPGLGGIRGHNFDAAAFPVESHDVVGHVREGDTLWAKLYVPPGEGREDMRRRKARGGKVGTSILGKFAKRISEANGQWRAKGLKLESLDLGPITRTALNLGGAFAVVSELESETVEDGDMDREQVIAELKPGDLPQTLREAIIREHEAASETVNTVAELRAELGEKDTLIAELTNTVNGYKRAAREHRLDSQIAEMVKVEALRPMVKRAVTVKLAEDASDEQMDQALAEYLDGDEYKPIAEALVAKMTGPHAFVGAGNGNNWRDELAENAGEIAKKLGVAR